MNSQISVQQYAHFEPALGSANVDVLTLNRILLPFGFESGITRFNRSTHPDPAGYLKAGLMANHREKYP